MRIPKPCLLSMMWLVMSPPLILAQTEDPNLDSCLWCHGQLGEESAAIVEGMKEDVHASRGLSCADCHGGNPRLGFDGDMEAAMNPAKGYVGAPGRGQIPEFCARCHSDPNYMRRFNPRLPTDQFEVFQTSIHGQRLKKGDTRVATCVDCHGVHGIRGVRDALAFTHPLNIPGTCGRCHSDAEYMQDYKIPTDQVELYRASVHGNALLEKGDRAAPVCNDCHGNHGAFPPQVSSIATICGQCHLNNSELFLRSPHFGAFQDRGLPECETCHGHHSIEEPSDEMLGAGETSVCTACHEDDSKGYLTGVAMYEQILNLKTRIGRAEFLVSQAERAGMHVSEARYQLNHADDALIKARTTVHSLSVSQISSLIEEGNTLAEDAIQQGDEALVELQYRRKGLALALLFILTLAAGLYLQIKEVDRKDPWR